MISTQFRTRLSGLVLLLAAASGQAQTIRDDEAIPPTPFDPPGTTEENEAQSMFDRSDWLNVRFSGPLDKYFYMRTLAAIQAQAARHPELLPNTLGPSGVPRWRSIGPVAAQVMQNFYTLGVVDSGRVRTILPHPTDPNILYVLSSGGGLWKTTNFNSPAPTWTAVTDSTVTTSGGAAALGRTPDILYLGLGDPFDGIALVGGVMLRSLDGGATWGPPVNLPTAGMVTDIKVDTTGAQDMVLAATDGGLYRSVDGGTSYAPVGTIPAGRAVASIARTSLGWLVTTFIRDACCRYGIGNSGQFYYSTDNGATFSPGPANIPGAARITLAVGQPGDPVVYAIANQERVGANPGIDQLDMFRSDNGGLSWLPMALNGRPPLNPNPDQPNLNVMHEQAWYNQMLLVDPNDPMRATVYFGGNLSSVKTTNSGGTWTVLSNWLAQFGLPYLHADFHAGATSTASGHTRLFFGNDGGLFVSDDDGNHWNDRKNLGLVDHLLYSVTTSGADQSSVLTGLQDDGTRLRIDGNGTFNQTFGGDGFGVGWSQANGGAVLGSYVGNYVYYANQAPIDQTLWTEPTVIGCSYNGLEACNAYFYTTVYTPNAAADATGRKFFARSVNDVFRTDNGAQSWTSMSLTDPNRNGNSVRASPHVIGVHPTDIRRVAAAASGRRVRITTDGGLTWNTPIMPTSVTDGFNSNVAWINASSMYVASENVGLQTSGCWVAKTVDLGASWQNACTGLPQVPVSKVLVSPADPSGMTAYAATWIGVYRTTNGGRTWDQFGAGLPVVKVSDLYMPSRGGFLRIATYGRGVWEIATPR